MGKRARRYDVRSLPGPGTTPTRYCSSWSTPSMRFLS